MYEIRDNVTSETAETWDELVRKAENWMDHIMDGWPPEKEFPTADYSDISEGDIKALQTAIDAFLETLAEGLGHKSWAGHGTYYVSAASEAGLRLEVEAV